LIILITTIIIIIIVIVIIFINITIIIRYQVMMWVSPLALKSILMTSLKNTKKHMVSLS
jgi:hypothetical protein